MNDNILGTIIGLLMSGGSVLDMLRTIGGPAPGAASTDGLSRMMSEQMLKARRAVPFGPNQQTVEGAVAPWLQLLGVNPNSQFGQGASYIASQLYGVSPSIVGGIIGVPNGDQFFSMVANGASGINQAMGYGASDIFNPYSTMAAHKRTMSLARTAYGLGVRKDGGYDVSYGHGLNMDEMGLVTQRILSSRIPYETLEEGGDGLMRGTGEILDPEDKNTAEKFTSNLKRFGSKINEAVAMMTKVTGSVKETLDVLDRIGGGNFLGGTAEQASAVAQKAMRMATSIRVTSAMSGISPTDVFSSMQGLQYGIATGMGIGEDAARASGIDGMTQDMAYFGTMGYASWAAMNPQASPQERERALFVANYRTSSYMRNGAAAMAAAVVANKHQFSDEELSRIKDLYESGSADKAYSMIGRKIGFKKLSFLMNDEAGRVAAYAMANNTDADLLNSINRAGIQGNLAQAERYGEGLELEDSLSDISSSLLNRIGKSSITRDTTDAATDALRKMLTSRDDGLTEDAAASMNMTALRKALEVRGVDAREIETAISKAKIASAKNSIADNTMSENEEIAARERLAKAAESSGLKNGRAYALEIRNGNVSLGKAFRDVESSISDYDERRALRKNVFDGKMSRDEANEELGKLRLVDEQVNHEYTAEERMQALENKARRGWLDKGSVAFDTSDAAFKDFNGLQVNDALLETAKKWGYSGEGAVSFKEEAAYRMMSEITGKELGELSGEDLDKKNREVARRFQIYSHMRGYSVSDALKKARKEVFNEEQNKIIDSVSNDKNSGNEAYAAAFTSIINEDIVGGRNSSLDEMKKILNGEIGDLSGADAVKKFIGYAQEAGVIDVDKDQRAKLEESALNVYNKTGNISKALSFFMRGVMPDGEKKNAGYFAALVATGANAAAGNVAVKNAAYAGQDMSEYNAPEGAETLLSGADDAIANATQNRVSNMVRVGSDVYSRAELDITRNRLKDLSGKLSGIKNIDSVLLDAFGADENKRKSAWDIINHKIGTGPAGEQDRNLISTLREGYKIGGKSAMDLVVKGGSGLDEAFKEKGADEDVANITRGANRKDSGLFDLMKTVGDFIKQITPFISSSSIQQTTFQVKVMNPDDMRPKVRG